MFTENGAAAARLDDRGRLGVGMRGDIVVLREDLQDLPPDRVKDTGVIATINRGELVYLRP
jgi:predicted amidohydrolase YtcJ